MLGTGAPRQHTHPICRHQGPRRGRRFKRQSRIWHPERQCDQSGHHQHYGPGEFDLDGSFVNQGAIAETGGGFLSIDATLANTGMIEETGGGEIDVQGVLNNQGTITGSGGRSIVIDLDGYDPTNPDTSLVSWANQKTISVTSGALYLGACGPIVPPASSRLPRARHSNSATTMRLILRSAPASIAGSIRGPSLPPRRTCPFKRPSWVEKMYRSWSGNSFPAGWTRWNGRSRWQRIRCTSGGLQEA